MHGIGYPKLTVPVTTFLFFAVIVVGEEVVVSGVVEVVDIKVGIVDSAVVLGDVV